ncbi:PadR family transcriptional regulator [Luteimonas sp. BDR2-5]|nr:PadR family transcriptional regulator [Luteimonas sp. BDR2-5]
MFINRFDPDGMRRRPRGERDVHPRPGNRSGAARASDGPDHGRRGGRRDAEMHGAARSQGSSPRTGGGRHGGGRGGRGGRGGGRVFGQGDLRLIVLHLIAQSPRHGYELIKAIEEGFGGQYAPSAGAIYPTLSLLEEQDLIEPFSESPDRKKRYRITATGQAWLDDNRAVVDGVAARMRMAARAMAGEAPPERVVQAMHTLKHALLLRRGPWSDAEVERVARLLQTAADAIVDAPETTPADGLRP